MLDDEYNKMRQECAKLEHIEINEEEFIDMFIKENKSEMERAKLHATWNIILGTETRIGNKMVKIKKEKQ